MCVEWLRRRLPVLDEALRTYLFTQVPVTEVEEAATGGAAETESPRTGSDLGIRKL